MFDISFVDVLYQLVCSCFTLCVGVCVFDKSFVDVYINWFVHVSLCVFVCVFDISFVDVLYQLVGSCFTLCVGKEVWFVNCNSRLSMMIDRSLIALAEVSVQETVGSFSTNKQTNKSMLS